MKILMFVLFILNILTIYYIFYRWLKKDKIQQEELQNLYEEINAREKQIKDLKGIIDKRRNDISNSNEEICLLKTENEKLKIELSNTIKDTKEVINKLDLELATKEKLLIKDNKNKMMLEKSLNSKNRKIELLNKKYDKLTKSYEKLNKELEKANKVISFYRDNKAAPSLEKVKAYIYNRKAVLKKIKDEEKE